jgi:hypothetical protein
MKISFIHTGYYLAIFNWGYINYPIRILIRKTNSVDIYAISKMREIMRSDCKIIITYEVDD